MSSPAHLASMDTRRRVAEQRTVHRTQLVGTLETVTTQRETAHRALRELNNAFDNALVQMEKEQSYGRLYPPSPERAATIAQATATVEQLGRDRMYGAALFAAAETVRDSARLELAWWERETRKPEGADGQLYAVPVWHLSKDSVSAPGYRVTVLQPDRRATRGLWRETSNRTVRRSRARSLIADWIRVADAYVLRDPDGRLYVATPSIRLELIPTDIAPPPTEGDVLRAALGAYGFNAYEDSEGGIEWLAVPLDPTTPSDDPYRGAHFRISSEERTERLVSAHIETWGASAFTADGEHEMTLDGSPAGVTLAEDSARLARSIASYVAQHTGP
ncbi:MULTISPECIES: hypothetical protein [unclassified Streptomyces]|uniref:hypothetical protein n=1 Tax=unclassified Streptomyces TaxID=2593676 RepID=UPI0035E20731